jgi:3-oxoacyl-(acyl-carrier-protein) synthase
MDRIFITAASQVTEADARTARLGTRFKRLDLASQLALLAVESLGIDFDALPRDRIGICLGARAGSLAADLEFWRGRDAVGGPSPTLFAYTLPSAAIGEIAIRYRLTGPNLCLLGDAPVLSEAADWLQRGEVDACLCVECNVVTPALGDMMQARPAAGACALFLRRGGGGRPFGENDRDMEALCAAFCARKAAGQGQFMNDGAAC